MSSTTVYVLKCEGNKYYVGKTNRPLNDRLEEHRYGDGSAWTNMYKPIKVIERLDGADEFDEDKYTKKYMAKYGIKNVRGGSYTQVELPDSSIESLKKELDSITNKCYKCGNIGHYASQCNTSNIGIITNRSRGYCYRCGRTSHYANNCYATTDINGYYI